MKTKRTTQIINEEKVLQKVKQYWQMLTLTNQKKEE
jgi:hypothetical protein